jgi:hypothetical protein
MNKENCTVGQHVIYYPSKNSKKPEFGIITEINDDILAFVLYEGDITSTATMYSDLLELLVN